MNKNTNIVKHSLLITGVVLVLIGLLGFFNNPIFSIFPVNPLYDIIYLISGLFSIIFAVYSDDDNHQPAKKFAQWIGIIYILLILIEWKFGKQISWLSIIITLDFLSIGFLSKTVRISTPITNTDNKNITN